MLPEFLLTVENSMHDMARDDFHLLNGVQDCDKDMCPCSASSSTTAANGHMRSHSPHQHQQQSHPHTPSPNGAQLQQTAERSPLMATLSVAGGTKEAGSPGPPYDQAIKLEDPQSCDLFASPTKWPPPSSPLPNGHAGLHQTLGHPHHHQPHQQHPHHHQHSQQRVSGGGGISSATSHHHHHHHHHHHAALHTSRKLDSTQLLQGSEDPMICHGAATDDDHPADEFKSLIASVSGKQHHQRLPQQQHHQQLQQKHHQQHHQEHHQQQLQQHQQEHRHHQQHQQLYLEQQQQLHLHHTDRLDPSGLMINPLALKTKTSVTSSTSGLESVGLQVKRQPQNGCSSLTKQQLKVKAGLMSSAAAAKQQQQTATGNPNPTAYSGGPSSAMGASRSKPQRPQQKAPAAPKKKGAIKLRFHHQALPPEYLSHYEATQGNLAGMQRKDPSSAAKGSQAPTSSSTSSSIKVSQTVKLPPPKSAHENVRSWLQKIAEIQRSAQQQRQQQQHPTQEPAQKATLPAPSPAGHDLNNNNQLSRMQPHAPLKMTTAEPCPPPAATKRVINYSDLPYMGEITLNNCKPRRGRKPKKTDICHLIYKNYGTIFPGTPKNAFAFARAQAQAASLAGVGNSRKVVPPMPARSRPHRSGGATEEQPLNLCLRDQSLGDFYSLSSDGDEDEEDDEEGPDGERRVSEAEEEDTSLSTCTTPPPTPTVDYLNDTLLAANMRSALPTSLGGGFEVAGYGVGQQRLPAGEENGGGLLQLPSAETSLPASPSSSGGTNIASNNNQVVLHPSLSVYYQRLIQSGTLLQQHGGTPYEMIHKDNQLALKIPIPSGLFVTPPKQEKSSPKPSGLDYPEPMSTPSSIKSEASTVNSAATPLPGGPSTLLQVAPVLPAAKRKRSAIFIPPIPEGGEHTTIPATEVSICKFKFTGGAKPSLQEKKMLSVDSDGNYRYYSGTGDKANRGYEFFPRESLHQSGLIPGMQLPLAPVYVNVPTEKIASELAPPSTGLSDELLQIPEALGDASALLHYHPAAVAANLMQPPAAIAGEISPSATPLGTAKLLASERKKKSRRSMQREKLEKTFKERGFLIQTQQLESAEGATYCKFRQLKKFTRYLFRNWKDYLPGDVQQANVAAAAAAAAAAALSKYHDGGEDDVPNGRVESQPHGFESILSSHSFCHPGGEESRTPAEEEPERPPLASAGGGGATPPAQSSVVVEPAS